MFLCRILGCRLKFCLKLYFVLLVLFLVYCCVMWLGFVECEVCLWW